MPILPNLPEGAGVQRTVRLFPAAPGAQGGELPLLQRKVHLAQAPLDARPQGVARAAPPEAHGGMGSPAAREHERKHYTHLVNVGSHAMNPCAADFAGTRRPVERAGLVAAETDFLHPCVKYVVYENTTPLRACKHVPHATHLLLHTPRAHPLVAPATATCGGRHRTA